MWILIATALILIAPAAGVPEDTRAGDGAEEPEKSHWAFAPVVRPPLPELRGSARPATSAIDAFIEERLAESGLAMAPEADRRTLIRRLHWVLLGLPAAPEDVAAFVADPDPLAYERLVDRVLASPRYGERWARHWLDVIAFGETHGFEVNTPRENAWPFRDYVIRAFNEDRPYTRFVAEQLAGDVCGEDAATGFIVAAAALLPGQIGRDEESMRLARQDEVHSMVLTASSAFFALTVHCARCHDHKFDPISQSDYYGLAAVFAGVRHGERPLRTEGHEERRKEAEALRRELARLEARLTHFAPLANPEPEPLRETDPRRNDERFEPLEADRVRFTVHDSNLHPTLGLIEPCIDELEVFTSGPAPRNVALASAGGTARASGSNVSERHRLEHLHDGRYGNDRSWMSNERGRGWVEVAFARRETIERIVWGRDREGQYQDRLATSYTIEAGLREDGGVQWRRVAGTPRLRPAVHPRLSVDRFAPVAARRVRFTVLETSSLEPCIDELEVFTAGAEPRNVALASAGAKATASGSLAGSEIHRLEHVNDGRCGNGRSWISNEAGKGWVEIELAEAAAIDRLVWSRDREEKFTDRLAVKYRIEAVGDDGVWRVVASSADRREYTLGAMPVLNYDGEGLDPAARAELEGLLAEERRLRARLGDLDFTPVVYAGRFEDTPETTWRLQRGDPMQRREEVAPAMPARVGPRLSLPHGAARSADAPEAERRTALAAWITNSAHPLTARVVVNRLWQYHFGEGIVSTPSDFGRMGTAPSHPELLDWLASELPAGGWSLKRMHRLICLSSAFRQDSRPEAGAGAVDAQTRLLWRFPPRRLEAEAVRDAMLSVAGTLDLRMGGPGFSVFRPNDNYVRVYDPKEDFGPAEWRRMVYMTKVRMAQDGTFGALDCPDAGQVQPKRPRSSTPIQALNLFNSAFVSAQAAIFARRLEREAPGDAATQVRLGFRLALGRLPSADEESACRGLASAHGLEQVCRVLFNLNEFLFVE
jgi:hypothetical protein